MQQEIKLTSESSNTVFVDDVDVSKGVYAKKGIHEEVLHLELVNGSARLKDLKGVIYNEEDSFKELINYTNDVKLYTISDNKRIVTKREVTIDDLKSTDHIGFVYDNKKGHIVANSDYKFEAITLEPHELQCNTHWGMKVNSMSEKANELLRSHCKVIRFDSISKLYKWLAE